MAGTEPGADSHDLLLQIDVLDLSHDEVSARTKAPNRRDPVGQTDGPGDDFREHRLVYPIVLAIDQRDGRFMWAEEFLEASRSINTGKAAAEDQDFLWVRAHGLFEIGAGIDGLPQTIRRYFLATSPARPNQSCPAGAGHCRGGRDLPGFHNPVCRAPLGSDENSPPPPLVEKEG